MTTSARSGVTTWRIEVRIRNVLQVVWQVADDLLGQVVVQLVVGTGQTADERTDLAGRPIAEGRMDELERCGPALGARGDIGEDVRLERPAVGLAEQLRRSRPRRSEGRPS